MRKHSALAERLAALEARIDVLEAAHASARGPSADAAMLDSLRSEAPEGGGVAFAGSVELPGGRRIEWQMGHPAAGLLGSCRRRSNFPHFRPLKFPHSAGGVISPRLSRRLHSSAGDRDVVEARRAAG